MKAPWALGSVLLFVGTQASAQSATGTIAFRGAVAEMPSGIAVTVSVGVATFPVDGAAAEDLIGAADRALYSSKHNGRNRVTAAPAADLASA